MRFTFARAALALALMVPGAARAQPLQVVTVGAPAINCVFAPACTVTVTDFSAPLFGSGFLQSRTYQALPGSPAAGLWVYEYRIDLREVAAPGEVAMVAGMAIGFGPVETLDFDGDGRRADQVFVLTSGGLGSVGPVSAIQTGRVIRFRFAPAVHGASAAAGGQASYFFGMVSAAPPRPMTARLFTNRGTVALEARAPGCAGRCLRARTRTR
ncbi:MAG TPA: hypothetical protein VFJ82_16370 [Longimicrobium sp.]|nr:hypothetical protein [Longimicrobium sp.]